MQTIKVVVRFNHRRERQKGLETSFRLLWRGLSPRDRHLTSPASGDNHRVVKAEEAHRTIG
jgi:type II secretory pathway component PulM